MLFFRPGRVAIVVNSLLVYAGVEQRTLELARFLEARGYEVEVLVLREVGKVAAEYERLGVPVQFVPTYEYTAEGGCRLSFAGFIRLAYRLAAGRFGVIFCVQPPSSLIGRLALLPTLGRRVVAMERFLISGRSSRRKWLDRFLARWTTRIVCVSKLLKDQLMEECAIPDSKIAVVENGVSIEPEKDPLPALKEQTRGRFVFGCVGTIEGRKRQELLIEAMAELIPLAGPGRRPCLVLVGGGPERERLEEKARSSGIAEAVIFAGETAHPHDYYRLFDAFVFPSVEEGFGTAWAEAMAHSLPVICADLRPMNDYIRPGETGLLFAKDDQPELVATMLRVMSEPELASRLGSAAARYAREHFDRETQLAKLVSLATGRPLEELVAPVVPAVPREA